MKVLYSQAILILMLTPFVAFSESDAKYSRKDCIVRVNLLWDKHTSEELKESVIVRFAKTNHDILREAGYPVYSFPVDSRNSMYFQFRDACETRFKRTEEVMFKVKRKVTDFPNVEVSRDLVIPSINTIMITGESWVD